MPTLTRDDIYRIGARLLRAAGATEGHAHTVADHLAGANMAGHDSHGFIRIPQYLAQIKEGKLDPKAEPEVVREAAGTAQVDGKATFGQVAAKMSTELGISKARDNGISMVTMGNLGHTGRVGTYPEMAAREGMAAIMCTGFVGGTRGNNVAPFGGRARRLGTNPIAMSFPFLPDAPIVLDFATSVAAEGKIRVYRNRGHSLPDEWVLSKDGAPSRDPNDYYDGGSILPMGGLHGGHKGYALAFMVALLGGVLGEMGQPEDPEGFYKTGSSIIVMDLGKLAPDNGVLPHVENMVRYVKDTPLMAGSSGILYPGEIEANTRRKRMSTGVDVEQPTWDEVVDLVKEHGLEAELAPLPA